MKKIQRIQNINGVQSCWCTREQLFKPCVEFFPRRTQHGFQYYCRECYAITQQKGYKPIPKDGIRKGCEEMLTLMGYDVNNELTIHQQFLQKHFNV